MLDQYVRMVLYEHIGVDELLTPAYEITYAKNLFVKHVQRFAYWLLNKTKALSRHYDRRECVQEVVIDTKAVSEQLIRQCHDLLLNRGFKPKMLYIGGKQFVELAHGINTASLNYMPISTFELYNGLKVTVVPYMDGFLII